jgi:hypothetical protein
VVAGPGLVPGFAFSMNRDGKSADKVCECVSALGEGLAMTLQSAALAAALSLLLMPGAVSALPQDAGVPDQQQPQADQPVAEKPKCVTSNTEWKQKGKAAVFEIELQNSCDARLKCTVDAFVTGSRGQVQGHGTLMLAAAPKGQTTRNTYAMKVKSLGGMANVSHSCKSS